MTAPRVNRRIVVAGATGLVGRSIVDLALVDPAISVVHALVRRPLEREHPKLTGHVVDFTALPPLPSCDEVYLALGTTIRTAGSQAAFRAVDYAVNLAVAHAALAADARRIGLVSAMGASARSRVFYSRVKGELEDALASLACDALVVARPSLLAGDREALGQPARGGERLGMALAALLGPVIPANYRPIAGSDVARALLARVPVALGREVLMSGAMQPR